MLSFAGRSFIQKIITLFFISVISFLIIHLAPGEPSQVDPLNPKFTPEMVENFRKVFHLDKPLHIQYAYFYSDLFTGELRSIKDNQPVLNKIWERFLNSLPLFIVGTIITWTLSFPVGIKSAISRGGIYDRSTTFISYLLISIPGFFFAYILIIFCGNSVSGACYWYGILRGGRFFFPDINYGQDLAYAYPIRIGGDRRDRNTIEVCPRSDA